MPSHRSQVVKRAVRHARDVRTGLEEDALVEIIGSYDALFARSQTQVTARVLAAAHALQVVGRAGIGIDNIDRVVYRGAFPGGTAIRSGRF